MKGLTILLFSLIVIFSINSYSQWTSQGRFPAGTDTLFGTSGGHGVAVDPDGKVWVVPYRPKTVDSVFVADSNKYFNSRPVLVFNPDGTPAPFSPIKVVQTPERKNKVFQWSKTGITADNKGNMLINDYDELIMLDYKTGAGMHWAQFTTADNSSLVKAAADTLGNIFIAYTLPGHPVIILNSDLTVNSNAIDTLLGYGRTLSVSKDGNTIYAPRYSLFTTIVYKRASEFDAFAFSDSAFKGFQTEASNFNPANNLLYISSGSYNNPPQTSGQGLFYPKATVGTYYGVDVSKQPYQIVDSISWQFVKAKSADERNRGIAFTKDGKTAYLTAFGEAYYPIIEKFTAGIPGGVKKDNGKVVESYSLSQNYPNPFNPTTDIKFTVAKEGFVTLKVYDMLGKEVTTLVSEKLSSGSYTARLNGQNMTSGIYIYQLSVNGVMLSNKMTLLK